MYKRPTNVHQVTKQAQRFGVFHEKVYLCPVNHLSFCMRKIFLTLLFMATLLTASAQEATFPYPSMPDTLRTVQSRGRYLLTHYWDNILFSDTTQLNNPDICELGFVNFIDLFPRLAGAPFLAESMEIFAQKAFAENPSKQKFMSFVERYLDGQHSPMRNDITYTLLLKAMLQQTSFDEAEKEQLSYLLRNTEKNQVGSVATDFAFLDRQGKRHRLSDFKDQKIVLFFYHPDCDNCHHVTELLKSALPSGITVLAIYPDDDVTQWTSSPLPFPTTWIDGRSMDGEIGKQQTYYIRATPSIYLLDQGNMVLLKDTEPDSLLQKLKM